MIYKIFINFKSDFNWRKNMFVEKNFYMRSLRRTRKITIYVPDDYKTSNKQYPVLYINDGQNAFFDEESFMKVSWGFYDFVKSFNLDIIMVAIPCNFTLHKREDEYGPWPISKEILLMEYGNENLKIGGEGDKYIRFIVKQLKPYIDNHFPTDKDDCAMVGSSMGGIITTYAAIKYGHIFKKTASLSSAYWFYIKEFCELIDKSDLSSIECFYMDLGGNEGNGDDYISKIYYESNEIIYNKLIEKSDKINVRFFEDACHNEEQWRQRVPIFMELFYR